MTKAVARCSVSKPKDSARRGVATLSRLTTLTGCWTGWSGWTAKLDRRAVAFRTAEGQRPPNRDVETLRQSLSGSSLRTVG